MHLSILKKRENINPNLRNNEKTSKNMLYLLSDGSYYEDK